MLTWRRPHQSKSHPVAFPWPLPRLYLAFPSPLPRRPPPTHRRRQAVRSAAAPEPSARAAPRAPAGVCSAAALLQRECVQLAARLGDQGSALAGLALGLRDVDAAICYCRARWVGWGRGRRAWAVVVQGYAGLSRGTHGYMGVHRGTWADWHGQGQGHGRGHSERLEALEAGWRWKIIHTSCA